MKPGDRIDVLVCAHIPDDFHEGLLERALDSLQMQTDTNFETTILFDECSQDTIDRISMYDDALGSLRCLSKPRKEGLAIAKNYGLARCSAEWVAFLDADDQYMDSKIAMQREFLLNNPDVDVCGTLAWDLREDEKFHPSCFKPGQYMTHSQIAERLPIENCMCHGSMMIRKSALDHVGGYDISKEHLGREDWATWIKLLNAGFRFHNIPERLYIWSANTSVER